MAKKVFLILFFSFLFNEGRCQLVFKTPYGKKYHLGNCRMVENTSESLSIPNAISRGLEACKICKPQSNISTQNFSSGNKTQGPSKTTQCAGTTKAGNRCKHMTSISNGYCFQHLP